MMSKKQLAAMLTLHIIYLLLGASIFYTIESPLELETRLHDRLERMEIQNLLYENYIPQDPDKQDDILRKLSDYCGKSMFNYTTDEEEAPVKWDFYHSFFFSYTVVSTIGYGNLAPSTSLGRILMIFYALFGIPINGILLANLGEYFGKQLITIYSKYHKTHEERANKLDSRFQRLGMFGQIVLYLVPGFLFFIFLPACLFVLFEGWDYVAAVYYAFVTLTTIGFGDLVAGTVNNEFGIYFQFYEIFLIIWITFGLGYIVMLLGFITSGMRSKHIHMLEHKLVQNIKATQSKILSGFSRDVGYLRRIINEAYLMKVKPVYVEDEEDWPRFYKSASCPMFTFDSEPRTPIVGRKRANSENIHLSARDMLRIQSDTDLLGIDRDRTFTAAAIVKPAELLARVVNALGAMDAPESDEEEGMHMFSDEEILHSEKPHGWTIGRETIYTDSPKSQRGRALSIAVPNHRKESVGIIDHELTWSNGDTPEKYRDATRHRRHGKLSLPTDGTPPPIDEEAEADYEQPKNMLSKLNPFRKRGEGEDSPAEYLKKTVRGRLSMFTGGDDTPKEKSGLSDLDEDRTSQNGEYAFSDLPKDIQAYHNKTKKGRGSLFPSLGRDRKTSHDESNSDLALEFKNYQNKTKKGRGSLFPSFGKKSVDDDDEEEPKVSDLEASIIEYQNKTKKGRGSLFPSFNIGKSKEKDGDESKSSDLESSIREYQNKTKKGRGSLFPSFNIGKPKDKDEEDEDGDLAADIAKYQKATRRGRTSLFPTFDMSNDDNTIDNLTSEILSYQTKTKKGRGSLFAGDLDNFRNTTNGGRKSVFAGDAAERSGSEHELEQTSVADLIRALAVLHSSPPPPQRKHGTAHSPGLLDLLSSDVAPRPGSAGARRRGSVHPGFVHPDLPAVAPIGSAVTRRRGSVHPGLSGLDDLPVVHPNNQLGTRRRSSIRPEFANLFNLHDLPAATDLPGARRRGSIRPDFVMPMSLRPGADADDPPSGARRRRISVRQPGSGFTPSLATVTSGTELQSTPPQERQRKISMHILPPPPSYSEAHSEVSPSGPRTRRYSPASGGPSRKSSRTSPVPRMFSRMRKESVEEELTPPSETRSRQSSLTDVVIDDNKNTT